MSPPPPHPAHLELCHRHSAHPLPELPWERPLPPPPPALPCVLRPCYPCPTSEHIHPHSHTLPALNRVCTGDECNLFHYSSHSPSPHLSHQSLPTSPYREMFFNSQTPSSACPCRECFSRREHQSSSVRTFHPLHPDQLESQHWSHGGGLHQTREAPRLWESENQWEVAREAEIWNCKPAVPPFHLCHPTAGQGPSPEHPRYTIGVHQSYPGPLMEVQDRASSGYHTPPQPRHSCPCSSYQSSPAESHESRGYASGYQSGSASPLPAGSPSPERGRLRQTPSLAKDQLQTEQHKEEKVAADVVDKISQSSESKSDSNDQSSSPGLDSDHDYTVIGSNSPTHTEESVTDESSPQSQEASAPQESSTKSSKTITPTPEETPNQNAHTSTNSPQVPRETVSSDGKLGGAKIPESTARSNRLQTSNYATVIFTPVQVQLNGSALPNDSQSDRGACVIPSRASMSSSSCTTSPGSPHGSMDLQSSPQRSMSTTDVARLTPEKDGSPDTKPPSPVPDGYHTPTFPLASYYYPLLNIPHVPYTGYTAVTIPAIQPPLPEKKRLSASSGSINGHNTLLRASSAPSPTHHVTFSPSVGEQRWGSAQHSCKEETDTRVNAKFVQDSSKYWYKPGITRDQAIACLKDKEPGTFLIRDSNSFQGAYGLALKVATPPPNANMIGGKGDPLEQLVRHFLIETGPRGVKIKGCQNESYFGSLSALVYQHSITPISLPCALRIPEKDLVGELQEMQNASNTSTVAELLKQGAACNVLYLNSVETESLTGPEAVCKATKCTLALSPRPAATVVHFKVSAQGITLTDSKRRLFFRRHYPISTVTFSSLDPQDHRMFGFVARRTGSTTENVCHLFAEMDPEQPAVAIVNFINKVMLGPHLHR